MSAEPSPGSAHAGEPQNGVLRFGPFELDPRSAELWRAGVRIRIQQQPLKVLVLLASSPGHLLTREQIRHEVWPDGTFVDFEQSLNFCISQIRTALGDQAVTPRYVETLPRRGYRFIAPVARANGNGGATPAAGSEVEPVVGTPERPPVSVPVGQRRWLVPALAVASLVSSLAALALWLQRPERPVAARFERVTFRRGFVSSARFAPDGQIVYSASWAGLPLGFYAGRRENPEARRLAFDGMRIVGVSRDGEVAYLTKKMTLTRAPLTGGPPKPILKSVRTADWTPDGSAFAVARELDGLTRVEYPVGRVLGMATRPTDLRISPDGRRVAFLEHPLAHDDRGRVVVLDRAGNRRELSGPWGSAEGLAWSPGGDEVWFTAARVGADSALYAVSLAGHERRLAPSMGRLVIHDVAPDGRVLLERNTLRQELKFARPGTDPERDLSWFDVSTLVQLTPDGKRVLFVESGEGGGPDYGVYLRATDGTVPVRVGSGRALGLSPDGAWVLAVPVRDPSRLDLLPTGPGETRSIRDASIEEYEWAAWLPDGRQILVTGRGRDGRSRVFVRSLAGGSLRPVTPEGVGLYWNTLSPDGSRFVARCPEAGICLYPVAGGEPVPLSSRTSSPQMVVGWAGPDQLYVRDDNPGHVSISRMDLRTRERTPWREIVPSDPAGLEAMGGLQATQDGSTFAYTLYRRLSDLYVVEGLR